MASIKDALEESITDDYALVKILIYALPVYICYNLFSQGNMSMFYVIGFFTILMMVSILITCINNVRNGKNYVMPSFNIFKFSLTAAKALLALGPITFLGLYLGKILSGIQILIPLTNVQLIYSIIVWLIISSIIITSTIIYSKTEIIKDAYNFNLISNTCIDILLAILFYIPQLLLVNTIILGSIAYIFLISVGIDNPIFIYLSCMMLIMNISITGNYFAQIDYELIPRDEVN